MAFIGNQVVSQVQYLTVNGDMLLTMIDEKGWLFYFSRFKSKYFAIAEDTLETLQAIFGDSAHTERKKVILRPPLIINYMGKIPSSLHPTLSYSSKFDRET